MAGQVYVHPHRCAGGHLRVVVLLDEALMGAPPVGNPAHHTYAWTTPRASVGLPLPDFLLLLLDPITRTAIDIRQAPSEAELATANVMYASAASWVGATVAFEVNELLRHWGFDNEDRARLTRVGGSAWATLKRPSATELRWMSDNEQLEVRLVYRQRFGNVPSGTQARPISRCRGSILFPPAVAGPLRPSEQQWRVCVVQGQLDEVGRDTLHWMLAHQINRRDPELLRRPPSQTDAVVLDVRAHWLVRTTTGAIASAEVAGLRGLVKDIGLEPRRELQLVAGATSNRAELAPPATATDRAWLQWWTLLHVEPAVESGRLKQMINPGDPDGWVNTAGERLQSLGLPAALAESAAADDDPAHVLRVLVAVVLAQRGLSTRDAYWNIATDDDALVDALTGL